MEVHHRARRGHLVLLEHQEAARERRAVLAGADRPVVVHVDADPGIHQLDLAEVRAAGDGCRAAVRVALVDVGGDLLVEARLHHVLEVAAEQVAVGPELEVRDVEAVAIVLAVEHRLRTRAAAGVVVAGADGAPREAALHEAADVHAEAAVVASQEEAVVPAGGHAAVAQVGALVAVGQDVADDVADLPGALLAEPLLALLAVEVGDARLELAVAVLEGVEALHQLIDARRGARQDVARRGGVRRRRGLRHHHAGPGKGDGGGKRSAGMSRGSGHAGTNPI